VEVFARNGIDVVAIEVDDAALERGKGVLAKSTGRALDRGKITQEDADALHARVTYTTDMGDFADCQLVVEAVPEHLHLKKELFAGSTPSSPRMPSWRPTPPRCR
jgi:3-hydroxybutyryl-CoA dehydrogenase